ncbi:hypothetical protein TELCIR_17879, partial [Teladorsagia circumcincta]
MKNHRKNSKRSDSNDIVRVNADMSPNHKHFIEANKWLE